MAQKNASNFLTDNKLSVDQVEVFNKKTAFVTPLIDSAIQQLVITIDQVNDQALISGTGVLPAHSIIHEIEGVVTTAFTLDNGIYEINIGSASLGATGGTVANIFKGALDLTPSTVTSLAVGKGFSTRGKVAAALGSTKTGSFASTVAGNNFYTTDATLHAQMSSSGAAVLQNGTGGVMKISILYSKVL